MLLPNPYSHEGYTYCVSQTESDENIIDLLPLGMRVIVSRHVQDNELFIMDDPKQMYQRQA